MEDAVVKDRPKTKWEDIAGLEDVKEELKEALAEPGKMCKGILLFGPAGTGKSLLVNAVSREAKDTTYIWISAYSLRSDSEVKNLFSLADERRPSIIYVDDVDALCESGDGNISEEQRKSKMEFITQMTGRAGLEDGVMVIAATNKTWRLHPDLTKAFVRRTYISLPDASSRADIFKIETGSNSSSTDFQTLTNEDFSDKSEGFSGADITIAVRDAMMAPIRKIQHATHFQRDDLLKAIQEMKPSISETELNKFQKFNKEFGAGR